MQFEHPLLFHLVWLPVPLTIAYSFWCYLKAYPLYLEARIQDRKSPKSWVYLPAWWNKHTKFTTPLLAWVFWFVTMISWALACIALLPGDLALQVILTAVAAILLRFLKDFWIKQHYILQRESYFLDYRRLALEAHNRGSFNETDLRNRCMYEHQQALHRAEQSGRLIQYLRAKAHSTKISQAQNDNHQDNAEHG